MNGVGIARAGQASALRRGTEHYGHQFRLPASSLSLINIHAFGDAERFMMLEDDKLEQARRVATQHSEGFSIEHKSWLNLSNPDDQVKLIRACLALRNTDGGWLAIGVENGTGRAAKNPPADARASYDADAINKLIVEFSSDPFGVEVCFPDVDGVDVAVLRVPGGLQTPAVTKKPISAAKPLEGDTIYCRSMRGGQVSSVKANHRDLQEIMERCMRNRELDIGTFVRRHWEDLTREVANLQRTPSRQLDEFVGRCISKFGQRLVDHELKSIPIPGQLAVGVAWEGTLPDAEPTDSHFNGMIMAHPHKGGWPPWMDPRDFPGSHCKRDVRDGAWEGLIALPETHVQGIVFNALDFAVWDFRVGFFHSGAYADDHPAVGLQQMAFRGETWEKGCPPPWYRRALDRKNIARDVAIRLFTAQSLVTGLFKGQNASLPENLLFYFRFDSLKGRLLADYEGGGMSRPTNQAMDESVVSYAQLKMDSDKAVIAERTRNVLRPLFSAFGGEDLSQQRVDNWLAGLWV